MDLLLVEQEVKNFIVSKPKISSNEKAKRITKTLNLITEIYDKHQEELSVDEAYTILFGEENEL
jgi:hypothetical protein